MAYQKQTFKDNETVLKAENLDHIEYGIVSSAELDEEHIAHFKNCLGVVLFSIDLSVLGVPLEYGDLVLSAESLTIAEGGSGTFTVKLASAPSVKQTVYLALSDNTKMSVSPASLVFTPDNWATEQTVTLTALQDDDMYDDSITVTLTSKNVDGKSLVVTLSDDDKPTLVVDGLALNMDYTNRVDETSDIITDSVNGVQFTNFSHFTKVVNGIYGNDGKALIATASGTEWDAFIAAMKAGTGATFEWFGIIAQPAFMTGAGTIMQPGYNYGFKINGTSSNSFADFSSKMVAALTDGTTASAGSIGRSFTIDDVQYPSLDGSVWGKMPYYDTFIHIVFAFSEDGVFNMWLNGIKNDTTVTVENFDHWDIDASFPSLTMYRVYETNSEEALVASQRIYNRALTEEEVLENMRYNASRWGLATF